MGHCVWAGGPRVRGDKVELALLAVKKSMSRRVTAKLVGCGETAARN